MSALNATQDHEDADQAHLRVARSQQRQARAADEERQAPMAIRKIGSRSLPRVEPQT